MYCYTSCEFGSPFSRGLARRPQRTAARINRPCLHHTNRTTTKIGSSKESKSGNELVNLPFEWMGWCSKGLLGCLVGCQLYIGTCLFADPSFAVYNLPKASLPRTAEAALRRSIPAFNQDVQEVQSLLEDIQFALRIPQRKPWGTIFEKVKAAEDRTTNPSLLNGVPQSKTEESEELLDSISKSIYNLEAAVGARDEAKVGKRTADALAKVASLKLMQAPGLPYIVPREFASLPRLNGRAVIKFTIERKVPSPAEAPDSSKNLTLEITLDGYSAPLSAGTFAANVQDGLYNGLPIKADATSVAAGSPSSSPNRELPLEILPFGDFEPLYKTPLDVQGGERPLLPLSIYGAVSMPHTRQSDSAVVGGEFFVYKFDRSQAGLAGMSFDEGNFGVFGYVTKGADQVDYLQNGDVIVDAKVVSGEDKLVRPE